MNFYQKSVNLEENLKSQVAGNYGPADTLILAWWDPEQRIQPHYAELGTNRIVN